MAKNDRQLTGKRGEDAACEHLRSLGHVILERNWRNSRQEVDIISVDPSGIHFVEVKSRTAPVMEEPEYNVGADKKRNVVRAAKAYVHKVSLPEGYGDEIFFDVISVVFNGSDVSLEYFPQAWVPLYL